MSNHALLLTLGHNSSAIALHNGRVLAGYEEERFSGLKSDSAFPAKAIAAAAEFIPNDAEVDVYVGHWFLDGKLPEPNKYWQPDTLKLLVKVNRIISLNDLGITHHDSHDLSAKSFVDGYSGFPSSYMSLVIDGFGTHGECISVYSVSGDSRKLTNRFYGFEKSLGMFYQYATSYMGMMMHNHEYKILAYEVHFLTKYPELAERMDELTANAANAWFSSLDTISAAMDPMLSLTALPAVKDHVGMILDDVMLQLGFTNPDQQTLRIICSRFTQLYVEKCVMNLIAWLKPTNLVVSGGFFYNVKINNMLIKAIPGKFSAMPLAGDQGAGIGVFVAGGNKFYWPGHLNWGHRNLNLSQTEMGVPGIIQTHDSMATTAVAKGIIENYGFVNIVRGSMEFGPRALCNTSTIAIPDMNYVKQINDMNQRTNEMPMAPVMTRLEVFRRFENSLKVHGSLEYMITALDYKNSMADDVYGAAHYYYDTETFTGRPQIAQDNDSVMNELLGKFGPLINTSFNYHGVPIVNTIDDIMYTHCKQRSHNGNVYTIVQGDSL